MNASVYRRRGEWGSDGISGRRGTSVPIAVAAILLPLAAVATATMCAALFAYVLFALTWKVSAKVSGAAVKRIGERRSVDRIVDVVAPAIDSTRMIVQSRPVTQAISEVSLAGLATAA